MTSRQHQDWINRRKPDSGLALPLRRLADLLAAAGYTVYEWPNDAHLDAEPPEDHTYYSETGWPTVSPKWWRHAIDIMPPAPGSGLLSLTQLGQRIFDARQGGQITWLKYMNWPSDGSLSRAVQDGWQPGHARRSSSDAGHIHLSSTVGCEVLDSAFNPLKPAAAGEEGDMDYTQDAKLTALFDFKDTAALDPTKPATQFPVALVRHIVALENALSTLTAKVDALTAQVGTPSVPATGDVTVSGTLHLG